MTKLNVFRRDPSTLTSLAPRKENEAVSHGDADGSSNEFGHVDPKKVLTKLDLRLIPVVSLLYLLSFLDRGNIGNARIEGMAESLNMTGPQYNWTRRVSSLPSECRLIRPSDRVFFHIRSVSSPIKSPPQTVYSVDMVTIYYGSMGCVYYS